MAAEKRNRDQSLNLSQNRKVRLTVIVKESQTLCVKELAAQAKLIAGAAFFFLTSNVRIHTHRRV